MTLRHLEYFIKVCEVGSISKAAEELSVAQPSVSQTIKEIEKYYNVVLFIRSKKSIQITKEGEELLVKAKETIASFKGFEDVANKITEYPKVRIGATATFGIRVLPLLIQYLKDKIPNLDYHLIVENSVVIEDLIVQGEIDFALTEGVPSNKLIQSDDFATDKLVCVAGNKYDIPNNISILDIPNYDLLSPSKNSNPRKYLDYTLALEGVKVTPRMESISNVAILRMVKENLGIAVLPRGVCQPSLDAKLIRQIELDRDLTRPLHIVYHKNKKFTRAVKKAINLSKEFILKYKKERYGETY